ncbi:MAG: hypothetical protein COA42_14885 [Alteromonadaceae bacterium]|nr:MAG: hypothetical protein COA42_14885 [Alteromonadaceae bacterium]
MTTGNTEDIPGYKLIKRIGKGGMATVYLAVQESFGRQVALKIMSSKLGEDSVWAKRFIHEAQVIAQLSHPNIVPVFDVGTHEGKFYISMEHVSGGGLDSKMKQGMPLPSILRIVAGVAAGLDFAGEKGFVHRDIKPDNIMFREDGSPIILDFGIVKQKSKGASHMTQTGTIVGTTTYMSPEQAQGHELDERSDIYSLGIMFHELLTGKPPFQADSDIGVLLKHVNESPPSLPSHLSILQPVVNKALAKNPEERYKRASHLIDHLQELEPEIKELLNTHSYLIHGSKPTEATSADLETIAQPIPDSLSGEATALHTLDTSQETIAWQTGDTAPVKHTSSKHKITEELEITKVLSSAKATIKDYSEAARNRRAKRAKSTITAAIFIAVSALAYIGYQQLYLVPNERAASEARLAEATLKTQRKIQSLIDDATTARQSIDLADLNKTNAVITIYHQVLKLDPENPQAQEQLDSLGAQYIAMAKQVLAAQTADVDLAESYRDRAQQLSPYHPEIPKIQLAIKNARASAMKQQLKQGEIDILLKVAESDITNSKGFSDAAHTKLQQVLHISPDNLRAKQLLREILDQLYQTTQAQIASGRTSGVQKNINSLERYYPEKAPVEKLSAQYQKLKRQIANTKTQNTLQARASRLQREKRNIHVNEELRNTYLQILKMSPSNRQAINGLNNTSEFEGKLASEAIQARDFSRTQQQIDIVEKYTPRNVLVKSLKAQLQEARHSNEQAIAALSDADKLLAQANTQSHKDRQATLKQVMVQIDKARSIDQGNPEITPQIKKLEATYVATITKLIANNDKRLIKSYFDDTAGQVWPSEKILKLKTSYKEKPKRVITGGF